MNAIQSTRRSLTLAIASFATLLISFDSTAFAESRTSTSTLSRSFQLANCGTERLHAPVDARRTPEYAVMQQAYERIFSETEVGRAICHRMAPSTSISRMAGVDSDRMQQLQRECEARDVSGENWIRVEAPRMEPVPNTCGESYHAIQPTLPRDLSPDQFRALIRHLSLPENSGQYDLPRAIEFVRAPRGHVVESWSAGRTLTIFVPPEGLTRESALRIAAHELAVHLDAKADFEHGISLDVSLRANDPERIRQVMSSNALIGPAFAAIRAYRVEERILRQANPQADDERTRRLRRLVSEIRDAASCRRVVAEVADLLAPSKSLFRNGSQTCEVLTPEQVREESAQVRTAIRGLDGVHFRTLQTDEIHSASRGRAVGQDACLYLVEPELTNGNRTRSDGPSPGTGRLPP